jgi:hypothetical protein
MQPLLTIFNIISRASPTSAPGGAAAPLVADIAADMAVSHDVREGKGFESDKRKMKSELDLARGSKTRRTQNQ